MTTVRELIVQLELFLEENEIDDIDYIVGGCYGSIGDICDISLSQSPIFGTTAPICFISTDINTG